MSGKKSRIVLNAKTVFMLVGIATFIGFVYMSMFYVGERTGLTPWMSLIYNDAMTDAENILRYMSFTIFTFFVAVFIIYIAFKKFKKKKR